MKKALDKPFYHKTIKRVVVVFGTVFNSMKYVDDFGEVREVPLFYAQRDKFLSVLQERKDAYDLRTAQSAPRMAYNLTGIAHAPQRHTDSRHRITSDNTKLYQYNRVPYDFTFELYLKTVRFEESLQIIEQIIPLFSPSFNVTADDVDDFGFKNDFTITLDSVGWDDVLNGSYDAPREILWTLGFTVKGYMYNDTQSAQRIKETIVNMTPSDLDGMYTRLTSVVVPRDAEKTDPHVIVDTKDTIDPQP